MFFDGKRIIWMRTESIEHKIKSTVYIVDGLRTPYLKAGQTPGPFSASDLAVAAARSLLTRQVFQPTDIDEVILGCIMPRENEANIGRLWALRAGCGEKTPGWTVQRNCGSGLQAIDSAFKDIQLGRAHLVLTGGTEAMSRAPLIFNERMVRWMMQSQDMRKKWVGQLKSLMQFRLNYLNPIIALKSGLTDPLFNLNMGETAEILASEFHITRSEMDAFACRSQRRLLHAQNSHYFDEEITPLFDRNGKIYFQDEGVRPDTSLEKLARLKPVFDRFGSVTAGNSSQISDGAALLLVASESAVQKYHLPVLGRIIDIEWAALSPVTMGLGPVFATTPLLQRHELNLFDIDCWEINEAFAATVMACVRAWMNETFCKQYLGLSQAWGQLDEERLNIDGGAIAIGHPVGSSGARLVLHLLHVLKRRNAKLGVATLCIGGGQGGALLLERTQS
jgi:acetyl-CoA C-acetyltransferase